MEKENSIENILNSIENVKDLYQSKIPVSLLKKYIEETKNNYNDGKEESWGNEKAQILILGSVDDKSFNENDKLWCDILQKGMKLKREDVYCRKCKSISNVDFNSYKYILCLGDKEERVLKDYLKKDLERSQIFYVDEKIILETYSIDEVNESLIVKKLFWNDLKKIIREIV